MPNHVKTIMVITPAAKANEVIDAITKVEKGERFVDFNTLIPMPDDIYRGALGFEEREKYGKNNWYDWSCDHWGTKWNAYDCEFHDNVVEFSTAWAAPDPIYCALGKKFPKHKFEIRFADEDLGCNCGEISVEGDEISFTSMDCRDVDETEALRFACEVWGETPEDLGYRLENGRYVYHDYDEDAEEDDEE